MASAAKTIGRGGAGNFASPASLAASTTPSTPDTRTVTHTSMRSGRGGAGNINTPASSSSPSAGAKTEAAARPDAVVIAEAPKKAAGEVQYSGRGGVGNWKVGAGEEERRRGEEEEGRRREVERAVRGVVDGERSEERRVGKSVDQV